MSKDENRNDKKQDENVKKQDGKNNQSRQGKK